MVAKPPDRVPEGTLGCGTENLRGFPLPARVGVNEPEPPAPRAVVGAAKAEREMNELTGAAEGIEVVLDWFPGVPGGRENGGLQGHQGDVLAGLRKDTWLMELDNS